MTSTCSSTENCVDKLLLDGDMVVHRATVAVEKDTRFLDRYHLLFSDAEAAWNVLQETLGELTDLACTDDVVFAFSDPDRNFRKGLVGDDYKSKRAGVRKPLAYWATRERIEATYPSVMNPTLEADDTMGIMMTAEDGDQYILWSLDKDLKQIPGRHLDDDEIIAITEESGTSFFYTQVIAGDPVDGYPGCPGIGMDRAVALLEKGVKLVPYHHELKRGERKGQFETRYAEAPAETPWETVVSCYEKAGQGETDALYNAQMARILRDGEYENGKVNLWTP